MAFDATEATDLTVSRSGPDIVLSWTGLAPAYSYYQVYINRVLTWSGFRTTVTLPLPRETVRIAVGSVDYSERYVDYSGSLPTDPEPDDHVTLTWQGGSFLGASLAGFAVYGSAEPGGPVLRGGGYGLGTYGLGGYGVLAAPYTFREMRLGYVASTVADVDLSGYGLGGYGYGEYGSAGVEYTWRSGRLDSGDWTFAVVSVDASGTEQDSPATVTATIESAPLPPAADSDGIRLSASFAGGIVTLTWDASPSA